MLPLVLLGICIYSTANALNTVRIPTRRKRMPHESTLTLQHEMLPRNEWVPWGAYFVNLQVGTPPQRLELLVDTGSSDVWLPDAVSDNCREKMCAGGSCKITDMQLAWDAVREGGSLSNAERALLTTLSQQEPVKDFLMDGSETTVQHQV